MPKKGQIYIHGKPMSAKKFAEAHAFNQGVSRYIKARREAAKKARQIREKNGPLSMEWVQSALFLYAVKKNGLEKDLRKALWAYTSAMIIKLEEVVTSAERIASREGIADPFHWVALQLRAAIREHSKLLSMMAGDVVEVPPVNSTGKDIRNVTHRPTPKDSYESMSYLLTGFRKRNPDAEPYLPQKDED